MVVDSNFPGTSKHVVAEFLKLHAFFFTYYLPTRQNGNILKHLLSLVSEPRSFNCANPQGSTDNI